MVRRENNCGVGRSFDRLRMSESGRGIPYNGEPAFRSW